MVLALFFWVVIACFSQALFSAPYSASITTTPEKTASPGDFVTHVYTITNTGTLLDTYHITVITPEGWITLGIPSTIQVAAGASDKIFVTFVVPSTEEAGTYEGTLVATSTGNPSVIEQGTALTTISPVSGVEAAWIQEPPRARPGESVKGTFSLKNAGNIADSYTIEVSSARNCDVSLARNTVALFAGEITEIEIAVSVPTTVTPGLRYSFTLEIASIAYSDIFTTLVHSSRAAPPPPEEVKGVIFPLWPITVSLSLGEEGFTGASFSGSGELEGIGTLAASTSATLSELAVPTGSFSTDTWRISLAGGGVSGGFGGVSGEGTGVTLFGKVGGNLSSQLVATEDAKGFSVSCRWINGSLRIIAGSDVSTNYGFQEIQFSQTLADTFSLTGSLATVSDQTSSGTAFRISPQVTVDEYRISGGLLDVSPGFPNRNEEEAYSMTLSYVRSRDTTKVFRRLGTQQASSLFNLSTWTLGLDTSKVYTQSNAVTVITSGKTLTGKITFSMPSGASLYMESSLESKKSDDTPTTIDQGSLGLNMKIGGPLFGNGKYSFSTTVREPSNRIADTQYLSIDLSASICFSLDQMDISSSVSLGRINDLKTGLIESESSSFLGSLSFPGLESAPKVSLSVSNGSASLGIGLSWGDLSASASVPLSEGGSLSASISNRFSIALPFWGPIYGQVTGWAFVDANGNGLFDSGEKPIPGLLLTLVRQEAVTGSNGRFAFWPVRPGTYELSLQRLPAGLAPRLSLPLFLHVSPGEHQVLLPFESYSSISGLVYNDANHNGRRDSGESGISGVIVSVTGTLGRKQATTGTTGRFNVRVEPGLVEVSLVESSLPKRFLPTTSAILRLDVGTRESKRVEFGAYQKPREIIFTFGQPTARFHVTPGEPVVGAEAVFDASPSEAIGADLVSYDWTFQHAKESFNASGQRVAVKFGRPGRWLVTLVVADANGQKNEHQLEIVVHPAQ